MYHKTERVLGGLIAIVMLVCVGESHAAPTNDDLWRLVQDQAQAIADLTRRLEVAESQLAATSQAASEAEERVDAMADVVEEAIITRPDPARVKRTHLGGYGELHYNNTDSKDEVDFHRFVLYASHDFTDRIHFFSELELEHALTVDTADGSGPGEVELEQAWISFDLNDRHRLKAGMDVLPIGIVNWTHEPDTFFGVERNRVENVIIPTTWWEAMIGFDGEIAPGWNYNVLLHSGLDTPTSGANAFRIRSGRSKVAQAAADDPAITGALRYTGIPGLEIGIAAQYQGDVTQGDDAFDVSGTLVEGHMQYRRGMFGFRALGARWDLDDDGPVGMGPAANGRDEQFGFYLEPELFFDAPGVLPGEVGLFLRYSYVDDKAGIDADTEIEELYAGLNYWPNPGVVFKFDLQNRLSDGDDDGFNLGFGYSF